MPNSRLRQLAKFIRVFGITGGIRLWCALLIQLALRAGSIEVPVPGLAAPIRLRRQDLPIFWQIMVMQANDFQSLPQAIWLKDAYKAVLPEPNRPRIVA